MMLEDTEENSPPLDASPSKHQRKPHEAETRREGMGLDFKRILPSGSL